MGTLSEPKRILITGASRGIGRAAAVALARAGHVLVLAARNAEALTAAVRDISEAGGRAEALVMDVTDDASVDSAIQAMLERGPCDVLVNNAGSCDQTEFLVQGASVREAEMALNYFGALRVTRALLPALIAQGEGLIVNVSSLLGSIAAPGTANYSATKAALEAWSHALRHEVARFGVRVSVFVAPHTATDMGKLVRFEGVPSMPTDYTARALIRAIDRGPRVHAGSPVYRWLLWLARLFPRAMEQRVAETARPAARAERTALAVASPSLAYLGESGASPRPRVRDDELPQRPTRVTR